MTMVATGVSIFSRYLLPCFRFSAHSSAALSLNFDGSRVKACNGSMRRIFACPFDKKSHRHGIAAVGSKWESSVETYKGVWEDPDDGSGSDYDEEDEESEDYDLDYESDWEEETVDASPTACNYEEDLAKEVEQLLEPEERAILQQNESPNLGKISTAKWKPLQTFALSGQIAYMDQLLDNGIDINSVDKDGLTALHKATVGKKEAVISHLLRKGANPHVTDRDGATPLHYAVQVGAMQTVKLLIKFKADVNVADNEGWTPLHIAIQSRNRDIAKVLLVNGADKTRRTKDGMTALDISLCYGKNFKSYDLAKLLKIQSGVGKSMLALANVWSSTELRRALTKPTMVSQPRSLMV